MSIESFTQQNQDSYSHLFFIYNTPGKEVIFSSLPMENFFETDIDWQLPFPFLQKDPHLLQAYSLTQGLEKKWQSCLRLNEKESENFSFMTFDTDHHPVHFFVDAVGINSPFFNNSSTILFAVKKHRVVQSNIRHDEKNRDSYRKDYAEFIDIAAHDLDAPLRKISLLVDRLVHKNQTGAESDLQGYFDRIQTSLAEMRSLVDNLSALAGLTTDRLQYSDCDLNAIVEETIEDLRQKHPLKKINAVLRDLPVLPGDKSQYHQLFQRLLQNAVRYSRKDEDARITVAAEPLSLADAVSYNLDPAKKYTRIRVSDEGIGFGYEFAEKIFQPFIRLHGKSEYPGTGMGLAICKKIVENHGGIIYADSKENKGATFTLILPQSHSFRC